MPAPFGRDIAQALETILHDVEAAAPAGIRFKRTAFKQETNDNLLNLRVELLAASLLARAGIGFDFGRPHPDLVCHAEALGIEVATRNRDVVRVLHDRLEEALAELGIDVMATIQFDHAPLWIPEDQTNGIVDAVVSAAQRGDLNVSFSEHGLRVGLFPEASTPAGRVFYNRGGELGSYMEAIEREIQNKVEEKRRQAGRMPTVLLIDISRLGMGWLRPPEVWANQLANRFLPPGDFLGLAVVASDLTGTSFTGAAVWRDDLPSEQVEAVRRVMAALVEGRS
jgi:hypothetical protein